LQRLSKWECKKESCSNRCKWYKARLPCTTLCWFNFYIVVTHGLASWFVSGRGGIFKLRWLVLQEISNIWWSFKSYNICLFDKANIFCVNIIKFQNDNKDKF
jgi:hypothetical protein